MRSNTRSSAVHVALLVAILVILTIVAIWLDVGPVVY